MHEQQFFRNGISNWTHCSVWMRLRTYTKLSVHCALWLNAFTLFDMINGINQHMFYISTTYLTHASATEHFPFQILYSNLLFFGLNSSKMSLPVIKDELISESIKLSPLWNRKKRHLIIYGHILLRNSQQLCTNFGIPYFSIESSLPHFKYYILRTFMKSDLTVPNQLQWFQINGWYFHSAASEMKR